MPVLKFDKRLKSILTKREIVAEATITDAIGKAESTDKSLTQVLLEDSIISEDAILAALSEESDTLEEVYEPFLIQEGLLQKTPRGRIITLLSVQHLQKLKDGAQ